MHQQRSLGAHQVRRCIYRYAYREYIENIYIHINIETTLLLDPPFFTEASLQQLPDGWMTWLDSQAPQRPHLLFPVNGLLVALIALRTWKSWKQLGRALSSSFVSKVQYPRDLIGGCLARANTFYIDSFIDQFNDIYHPSNIYSFVIVCVYIYIHMYTCVYVYIYMYIHVSLLEIR